MSIDWSLVGLVFMIVGLLCLFVFFLGLEIFFIVILCVCMLQLEKDGMLVVGWVNCLILDGESLFGLILFGNNLVNIVVLMIVG